MPKRSPAQLLHTVEEVLRGNITWETIENYPVPDLAYVGMALIILNDDIHSTDYTGAGYELRMSLSKAFDKLFIAGRRFTIRNASTITDNCKRAGFVRTSGARVFIDPPAELEALARRYERNAHVEAFLNHIS